MNDPIIHAPLSKIVEAIMKATYPPQKLNHNYKKNYEVEQMRYRLKEALASLGGEEQGEWYCPKCQAYLVGEQVTFEENHATCGTPVYIKQSHPSVREVLEGFVEMIKNEFSELNLCYLDFVIDRYLSEKGGEG